MLYLENCTLSSGPDLAPQALPPQVPGTSCQKEAEEARGLTSTALSGGSQAAAQRALCSNPSPACCQFIGLLPSSRLAGFGAQKRVCLGPDSRKHYLEWELEEGTVSGLNKEGWLKLPESTHEVYLHRAMSYNRCTCTYMHSHTDLP